MLMLSFSHAAIADDFLNAISAAQRGDFATAIRLWKPIAEQGDADAQLNLGMMYYKGQGVAKDYKIAIKWLTRAAEQGNVAGQYLLGVMSELGEGLVQDYVKAYMWYNIAAMGGNEDISFERDILAKKMTSAQIAQSQEAANRCIKQNFKDCD